MCVSLLLLFCPLLLLLLLLLRTLLHIIKEHCMHAVRMMRHIAIDGVVWSACLCVCLSVGHVCELGKNG